MSALKELFAGVPDDSGMAFVVVQHLDPTHASLTAEIVNKHSRIQVLEVHDHPRVAPNCAYVIPPGKYLRIENGMLTLSEPDHPRGARMAVDCFLRSLAEDQGEHAVAVILSGTGSDGSLGVKAVKEVGGCVIVQDPADAQHDGMPRRAIDTGVVDSVLPAAQIAEALLSYSHYVAGQPPALDEASGAEQNPEVLGTLLAVLRKNGRRDFRAYKENTLLRRIRRRAALNRIPRLEEYARHLEQHRDELAALERDLLINVTRFFRDKEAWEHLAAQVVEPIVARVANEAPIRAWVPGCATGEEAYSVALLFMEELRRAKKTCPLQIFATDIANHALDVARIGRFPQAIESDVPAELLRRYFVLDPADDSYRVGKALREAVVFSNQDLMSDPPFSRLHLICCRNVLIYLKPEIQQKIIALFHFALAENGLLFLGSAETIGALDDSFETLSKRWRIFRRIGPTQPDRVDFPVAAAPARRDIHLPAGGAATTQITHLAERWLLDWLAPSAVLINRKWRILYISGDVDAYLARNPGAPTDDLLENVRKGLTAKLRGAVLRALEERRTVTVSARVQRQGGYAPVQIVVRPLPASGPDVDHLLVLFADEAAPNTAPQPEAGRKSAKASVHAPASSGDDESPDRVVIRQLEEELASTRSELRATIEQLESAAEEYKAANEEVMSINEELRSTNEELETSKEELQSLNEELHTVNDQLATKVAELETKNADLENLQAATDIATICIDTDLRVRWFTPATAQVIRLQAADKGRPLSDLSHDFAEDDLEETTSQVLRKLTPIEGEVECGDGRTFMRRVTPYRTDDHRIGGVVITFVDITRRKRAEQAVIEAKELAENVIDTVAIPMLVLDRELKVNRANSAFAEAFGVNRDAAIGMSIAEICGGAWSLPELHAGLAEVLGANRQVSNLVVAHDFERVGRRTYMLNARRIDHLDLVLLVLEDVTERAAFEEALRSSERRLRRVIETEAVGITFFDRHGTLLDANDKFLSMSGLSRAQLESRSVTREKLTPPDYTALVAEQWKRLEATGRHGPYEQEALRQDGSRYWMMVAAALLDDDTVVEFCLDITSRKSAERALVESDRRKDEFLATLAHELRNPLAPLSTAMQVLRAAPDEQRREQMYAMMERQLTHLVRLVDDLLDVSRISRGFVELKTEPLDVASVLQAAIETSRPRIEAAGRQLTVTLPSEPMIVQGDAVRLAQVVINLLNNATSYTGKDGRIWLAAERDGRHAVVRVRDDGVGIDQAMLPRVFEMFVQVDRARAGGLGIGLTLARSLVLLHGGTIEVSSDGLGRGSEFTVRLPLAQQPAPEKREGSAAKVDLGTHKVLVVDDNRDAADSLGMLLGLLGAEVAIAYDGAHAVALAGRFRPELVFLDLGMPGMDGYDVARALRAQSDLAPCTLVAVTGWGQAEDRRRTSNAGFDHHLTKPVNPAALRSMLANVLSPRPRLH